MKNYLTIFIFIFLVNCSFSESKTGVKNTKISSNEINFSKEYSFEEYINLLLNNNKFKNYPDINDILD